MKFEVGTPVYHWNDPGVVIGYTAEGSMQVQLDHGRYQDEKGPGKVVEVPGTDIGAIEVVQYAQRSHFFNTVEPGQVIPYSPYGYIITEDGKAHVLLRQWVHGIVLSMLFPDHAKAAGYRQPDKESNVYHYQRYELDYHNELPVVRIAFGMMTAFALSKGHKPATEPQIEATRLAFKAAGLGMRDEVSCDYSDMPLAKALESLRTDTTPAEAYELTPPDEV